MHNDIGVSIVYDGDDYTFMRGCAIRYPIGGLITEVNDFSFDELKPYLLKLKGLQNSYDAKELSETLFELEKTLIKDFNPFIAGFIIEEMTDIIVEYRTQNREQCLDAIKNLNKSQRNNKIFEYIFKDTGFTKFGIDINGELLFTAYYVLAEETSLIKGVYRKLCEDEDYMLELTQFYTKSLEFQHITVHHVFYDGNFHSMYTIRGAMSLLLFELTHILQKEAVIKKCPICGRYFVLDGRNDAKYCNRLYRENKTCRDVGAQIQYNNRLKKEVTERDYRKIYQRLKMRSKRRGDIKSCRLCSNFTEEGKKKRHDLKNGLITVEDFYSWLESYKAFLDDR